MKLVIQIPAFNEAETILQTIRAIPRNVTGITEVLVLVVDDGSTDNTIQVAQLAGADHVLRLPSHVGLARTFCAGIEEALRIGADIIVNTDADNQYCADDIAALVQPILDRKAQIVIGCRPISEIATFSRPKKALQKLGSWVVRKASGTDIPDAPSGFRAYAREAAAQLCVTNAYSYTLETIIQAGHRRIPMTSVAVRVNRVDRPSRLVRSTAQYVFRSAGIILRSTLLYAPHRVLGLLACLCFLPGALELAQGLVAGEGLAAASLSAPSTGLLGAAAVLVGCCVLGCLMLANRCLLEDIRARALLQACDPKSARLHREALLEIVDAR